MVETYPEFEPIQFLDSDTESVHDGILLCQGCASTKYPVDSKMCPTCGFPNAEYRKLSKSPERNDYHHDKYDNRPRVKSVDNGYITSRKRNEKQSSRNHNKDKDYSTRRTEKRSDRDRTHKRNLHRDTSSKKRLEPRYLDHRPPIRSGQKVPLNSMMKTKQGKPKDKPTGKPKLEKKTVGIQASKPTANVGTSTQRKSRLSHEGVERVIEYVTKAEHKCLIEIFTFCYNQGVEGNPECDMQELFDKFQKERKRHLKTIVSCLATKEQLPEIPTDMEDINLSEPSSVKIQVNKIVPETPRNKFCPNAQTKPKVSFDDPEICSSDNEEVSKKPKQKTKIRKQPSYNVNQQIPAVKRKKKMSFDDHHVRSDDELRIEQEKIFNAARIRQGTRAYVNGDNIAEKYASMAKFDVVAKGNNSVNNFQPLFYHKNMHPNPYSNNPYDVLGVPRSASQAQLRKQYKNLCFLFHPDKNKHPEATTYFEKINEAYTKVQVD